MTDPATAQVPTHDDASPSATPFQVLGSSDAGYCVDGVCILPADRDVQRVVAASPE
jgi:hypothetical protein